MKTKPSPVFFDVEASGLGPRSFPIEIGWAFADGRSEAHLIQPPQKWLELPDAWTAEAQQVHGIARETLIAAGKAPRDVADRMNSTLAGCELYASAPEWDEGWLRLLFHAAKINPTFKITLIDAADLIYTRGAELGVSDADITWCEAEAGKTCPRNVHRAEPDAKFLATWYALVELGQAEIQQRRARPRGRDLVGIMKEAGTEVIASALAQGHRVPVWRDGKVEYLEPQERRPSPNPKNPKPT